MIAITFFIVVSICSTVSSCASGNDANYDKGFMWYLSPNCQNKNEKCYNTIDFFDSYNFEWYHISKKDYLELMEFVKDHSPDFYTGLRNF